MLNLAANGRANMLLDERLLDVNFYLRSMSSFLRNSFGMEDRCRLLYGILTNVCDTENTLLSRMNIFSQTFFADNYESAEYESEDEYKKGTSDSVIDDIASIFGLQRKVFVEKTVPQSSKQQVGDPAVLSLCNYEFVLYIQAFIAKQRYDGTNISLLRLYNFSMIPILNIYLQHNYGQYTEYARKYFESFQNPVPYFLQDLGIYYVGGANPLTQKILLTRNYDDYPNIKNLFFNGLLTIESVGISYEHIIGAEYQTAIFDSSKFYSVGEKIVYLWG